MKILHIIPNFTWQYGGSVRIVYDLSKKLSANGHEVTIFTTVEGRISSSLNETEKITFDNNEIKVCYFDCFNNWFLKKLGLHISPAMRKALKNEIKNFDIIHLHECRSIPHVYAWYYSKLYKKPYILQGDNSTPLFIQNQGFLRTVSKFFYDKIIGNKVLDDAHKLIAISKEELENYLKVVSKESVELIYMGFDLENYKKLPEYGKFRKKYGINGTMILYLGRINSTKGIDFSLNAFKRILEYNDDLTFVVAGSDDGYKNYLEELIKEMEIKEKVIFTGFIDEEDKKTAYVDADVFLHTVVYMGGVGLTPLESILCNTPVIVTKECGEIIEEAECGYLVDYGDVTDLEDKLLKFIENREISELMINKGKQFILENLDWKSTVKKVEKIYAVCVHDDY